LVGLSIFAALGIAPADAEMINVADLVSSDPAAFSIVEHLTLTIEGPLTADNWLLGRYSSDRVGCGIPANQNESLNRTSLPDAPSEPEPAEVELVGFGIPGRYAGSGMDSGSSSDSGGSSSSNAMVCCVSALPQPAVIGRLYSVVDLDIPPAPPFELLRPPKFLTIVA